MRVGSRCGRDISGCFPELARVTEAVGCPALLDGELVVLGSDGRPDFEGIRRRLFSRHPPRLAATFMAFDLLEFDGERLSPRAAGTPRTSRPT